MVDTLSREPTAKMIEQGLIYLPGVDPDQLRDAWRIMWDMAQQEQARGTTATAIEVILSADPIAAGRFTQSTVDRLVALITPFPTCDGDGVSHTRHTAIPAALSREEQVRAEERERCAGIAESCRLGVRPSSDAEQAGRDDMRSAIAAAIRSAPPSLRASGHEGGERDG